MSKRSIEVLSALCLSALISSNLLLPVMAQEQQDIALRGFTAESNQLEMLDRNILKKEVELLKLNAEFRTHYTSPEKWKKRRLKIYDAAGGGIANAGDITLMSQFWKYWKHPGDGLKRKGRLEAGPIIVMIAYLTLGGLYAGEGM